MNEYEAHLSSYDHSHKQRLKDMKAMVRDPNAGARARKAEAKADGLISIKLGGGDSGAGASGGGGFKKGGFKKSGFKSAFNSIASSANSNNAGPLQTGSRADGSTTAEGQGDILPNESESEDDMYERYDPRNPTD
jgi:hypothetical protein